MNPLKTSMIVWRLMDSWSDHVMASWSEIENSDLESWSGILESFKTSIVDDVDARRLMESE